MAYGLYIFSALIIAQFTALALEAMGFFGSKKDFEVDGKTVLITGGSQGMGKAVAKLLASKGANVVIIARDEGKLAKAFRDISAAAKSPSTQRFNAISADVTRPSENARIHAETTAWNNNQPPDIVWQIAGSSTPGLFLETPIEALHAQMDLNYWAATYLSHATLKAWTTPASQSTNRSATGTRHLILTSSSAALCGVAGYTPYSPPKAAMRSLADNLKSEMNLYNGARQSPDREIRASAPERDIAVHLILPGTIESPGRITENLTKHPVTAILESGDPVQSEDEVAAVAVKGLEGGDYLITTNWLGHLMRAGMLGGSPRNRVVWDTVLGWVVGVAYAFIVPDMEGKVWKYGRETGLGREEGVKDVK
ncbi:3-dehydrosphinganine reductase [Oleoguttula sp. CCFEE 5521]